tara:strand:+ start:389 stop:916 length:528 start_codon:yes stop_codon:yes gene_type:complete
MKPLHTSYNNLSSWKFYNDNGAVTLKFNFLMNTVKTILVSILCASFGIAVYVYSDNSDSYLALVICIPTAILVSCIGAYKHLSEKNKPHMFIYNKYTGIVDFPQINKTIPDAKAVLSFSHERYQGGNQNGCNYVFNYVIDGIRHPFLKHLYSLKKISKRMERMGFTVTYYDQLEK